MVYSPLRHTKLELFSLIPEITHQNAYVNPTSIYSYLRKEGSKERRKTSKLRKYHSVVSPIHINFVSYDYEREILWIWWTCLHKVWSSFQFQGCQVCRRLLGKWKRSKSHSDFSLKKNLDKELLPPIVKIVKWLHYVNIIHKNTAVSTSIESHSQTLESFLTSCIPNLLRQKRKYMTPISKCEKLARKIDNQCWTKNQLIMSKIIGCDTKHCWLAEATMQTYSSAQQSNKNCVLSQSLWYESAILLSSLTTKMEMKDKGTNTQQVHVCTCICAYK